MALVPEADDDERSDGDVDEIDLLAYEQDPWDDAADFLHQQRVRLQCGHQLGQGATVVRCNGRDVAHDRVQLVQQLLVR